MTRRSNSSLPSVLPNVEPAPLSIYTPAPLAQASHIADHAAARSVFQDHQERLSPNTRRRHTADLASFAAYLGAAGIEVIDPAVLLHEPEAWSDISWGLIKGYVRWLLQEGYAIRSVNVRLSTVKVYAGLAHIAGVLDQETYSRIQLVKGYGRKQGKHTDDERRKNDVATRVGSKKAEAVPIPDDVAQVLKQPRADTPQARRDAVLMCLLLDHGLRCSEVADLHVEHFDVRSGTFTFYRRKVDLTQTHRMTRDTRRAVQAYLAQDALPSGPLLRASTKHETLTHAGLTTRGITKRVRELGRGEGFVNLSAHDCRHYWATTAVRNGTHVKDLQDAGGWASPIMPLQYAQAATVANEGVHLGLGEER